MIMEKITKKNACDPIDAESLGSISSIYREDLYRTKEGRFFLHCVCPACSMRTQNIIILTEQEARDWVWDNCGAGRYIEIFE